jgi:hypothetical protein
MGCDVVVFIVFGVFIVLVVNHCAGCGTERQNMRARFISTVFAVAGLLAVTGASSVVTEVAHGDQDGADRCVAKREAGVGPVCVVVNDVLSDILTA